MLELIAFAGIGFLVWMFLLVCAGFVGLLNMHDASRWRDLT